MLVEHADTLAESNPRMGSVRRQLEETVTVLGQGARADTQDGATRSGRFTRDMAQQFGRHLDTFEAELRGVERSMAIAGGERLSGFSSQLLHFLGTVRDEGMRRAVEDLREELDALSERARRGERLSDEETRDAEAAIALIEAARTDILAGRSGAEVAGQEEIIGHALSALVLAARLRAMHRIISRAEPGRRMGAGARRRLPPDVPDPGVLGRRRAHAGGPERAGAPAGGVPLRQPRHRPGHHSPAPRAGLRSTGPSRPG